MMKSIIILVVVVLFFFNCNPIKKVDTEVPENETGKKPSTSVPDKIFLMGLGMLRLNWASVQGNEIRFRYSDLGLPTDFSTRERASFMIDGTFADGQYKINGHLNYDPENRITEPPLEFLLNVGNDKTYLTLGDYQMGVLMDSVFSRYYHPFRGGVLGTKTNRFGVEIIGGLARGESGIEELPADSGAGPYYLGDSPVIRGSEIIYLVTKSSINPDLEIKRIALVRNQDYFIDYDRGSIIFMYPIYSFDELGNPVFILVSYQFESLVGRFSRAVMGLRAFVLPLKMAKVSFTYVADADKNQSLGDIFKNRRGIYAFGLNIDTEPVTFFGEFSFSANQEIEQQTAFFAGGVANISSNLHVFFNGWKIDSEFPTFANRQLDFGYSLFQIFPSYMNRNIFLSPFQFTRNLGVELYPFSLARLSIDEKEIHGFIEWDYQKNKFSLGYGTRWESAVDLNSDTFYISSFHEGEKTKIWGKFGLDRGYDNDKIAKNSGITDILLGARQQLKQFSKGSIFCQFDYKNDWQNDFLDITADIFQQTYSVLAEYLTGTEGYFAGYRKERLTDRDAHQNLMDADIFELGLRRHIYKGFFLDSRYRQELSNDNNEETNNRIISLGAGIETNKFRGMVRYEFQFNRQDETEGRRRLWSVFLFGSPSQRLNVSLRYYHQLGKEDVPLNLNERSEEQLNLRFLWRPSDFLHLYSQWRYDTNLELYPPLDRTKSNSLASVQGMKLVFSKRLEFLANYKLLKVWGPIENRKYSLSSELGYLVFTHFRFGIGAELIDFDDVVNTDANYHSVVGYFKLVAIF